MQRKRNQGFLQLTDSLNSHEPIKTVGMLMLYLLKEKRFLPLLLTQFFGAFNDNAFKLAMLTLVSYHLADSQAQSEFYQALAGALFILPFFIFSSISGQLADKYDKALITRIIKTFELLLIIIGALGLYVHNIALMMITLTGMGIHSAFFGPIKYAILPDHLAKEELLFATGLVEGSTFLAILLGTTLGTISIGIHTNIPYFAIFITLFAAFLGLFSSFFIPSAPSSVNNLSVDINLWRGTLLMLKHARSAQGLFAAILTISWFWLVGAVLLTKLPDYCHYVLGANTTVFALLLALFSVGIACGSLLINNLLKGKVTLSLVPVIMMIFSFFVFDMYWASPQQLHQRGLYTFVAFFSCISHWRIACDLFMLGACGGLFVVPLYTYLQIASPVESRARTIASNNIYNSLFMVMGTGIVILLLHINTTIPQVFLIFSVLNALVSLVLYFYLKLSNYAFK